MTDSAKKVTINAIRGLTSPELVSLFAEAVANRKESIAECAGAELRIRLELQARLLRTLQPFAEAGKEIHGLEGVKPDQQWLWKAMRMNRETAGISVQHVLDAIKVFDDLTS